ncbi:hypothetical protein O181_063129, partial [Austropuccinia psidii MF-1]|nr:hypothetical protein [Austropuccinia psidii MF-1]
VTRISAQLGTSQCGKLKASEWNALFNVYIPLLALDVFFNIDEDTTLDFTTLMDNLCALIQCTSIISSKAINKEDSQTFAKLYESYQSSSFALFKTIKVNPKHHYAMHMPEHIDWWGPPMGVSEFAGERLVGILQGFKSNHLLGSMEQTLMKKFCQKQRLDVTMDEKNHKKRREKLQILQLTNEIYQLLLVHLQATHPTLRDYRDLPHPLDALVLQNAAREHKSISWKAGLNISSSCPNNLICFEDDKSIKYGLVSHIVELKSNWIQPGPIFIVKVLKSSEEREMNFKRVNFFIKSMDIVQVEESGLFAFVRINKIISLAAYRPLPAWSLGIKKPTFLVRVIHKLVGLETQNLWDNTFIEDAMNT